MAVTSHAEQARSSTNTEKPTFEEMRKVIEMTIRGPSGTGISPRQQAEQNAKEYTASAEKVDEKSKTTTPLDAEVKRRAEPYTPEEITNEGYGSSN